MKPQVIWGLLLLAFTFVVGCGPEWTRPALNGSMSPPTQVTVCLDLPAEQLPAARLAVEGWDRALGQWKRLVAVDNGGSDECTYWVHEVAEANRNDDRALAWASMLGGHEISMKKGRYEHGTTGILLHELGHVLGAQHVPGTLMNATYWQHGFACPDATTVAQVAAWHRINLELLCWCY